MSIPNTSTYDSTASVTKLFDSHVHLDAVEFDGDRAQVLDAAHAAGITRMLLPAVTRAAWPKLEAVAASAEGLYPAYGLHPCYLMQHADVDLDALATWLYTHRAVAIGECGLDFSGPTAERERQIVLLQGHLQLAHRFDLPLVLHARRAFEQIILEVQRFRQPLRGVVHSFSGSLEQALRLRDLGFLVGFGGPATYPRAQRLRRTIAALPSECLLLETDAPDQPGAAHRGQRNEPAFLAEVADCVAAIRGESAAYVAATTTANACRLFGLDG